MRNEFRRILVATSSSIAAETMAGQAVRIADGLNAELIALHISDEPAGFADGQLALKKFAELGDFLPQCGLPGKLHQMKKVLLRSRFLTCCPG